MTFLGGVSKISERVTAPPAIESTPQTTTCLPTSRPTGLAHMDDHNDAFMRAKMVDSFSIAVPFGFSCLNRRHIDARTVVALDASHTLLALSLAAWCSFACCGRGSRAQRAA